MLPHSSAFSKLRTLALQVGIKLLEFQLKFLLKDEGELLTETGKDLKRGYVVFLLVFGARIEVEANFEFLAP